MELSGLGDAPKHTFLDPRLYNASNVQSVSSMRVDEDQERLLIEKWLAEKGKFQLNPYFSIRKPRCEINLSGAKLAMKNCLLILEKLDKTREELKNNVETMSSNEWKQKTQDIGCLKDEFDKSMILFEDNTILKSLKGMVVKRVKKRHNKRKLSNMRKENYLKKKEKLAEQHKSCDRWLESKKEEVERAKMEEKMKKDADCVLYEVTKKKSDARKQLSLISALVKLRTVRDNMATQRGEKLSLEDRKAFGTVTEKLIRVWENAYQNYCKEEQCLKIMLEDNATKDTKAALTAKQNRIVDEWDSVIFGPKDIPINNPTYWALTSADRDLESFIAIRKSWDTFLTHPENPAGSAIPLGWVMPPDKADENWGVYVKSD